MLNLGCKYCEKQNLLIIEQAPMGMGARRGTKRGALAPPRPWNLKQMTSYAPVKYPKIFARAYGARNTLYFSLKRREKTQKYSFAPLAHRKTVNFCRCCWFCPVPENLLRHSCPWASARKGAEAEYLLPWNLKLMTSYTVPL